MLDESFTAPADYDDFAFGSCAESGAGSRLKVSIFADRGVLREEMRDDALAAGLRVGEVAPLADLLNEDGVALGDIVLVDCPPSLNMLTLNGLCAANGVIVPMQCEYFALEGLTDLVNTIKQVHANLNKDLQIIGLLRVMFDPRTTLQQQVSEQLKSHFGDKVFNSVIPRNVRLAEAPSYGLPGVVFDPSAKGSQAFVEFAREMVERIQAM